MQLTDDEIGEWQDEPRWLATESDEAVVTVEGLRLRILGVNHQGKNGDFRSQAALDGIPQ